MKRAITLILALIMCISLCACGDRNVTSPGTSGNESGDTSTNKTPIADDGDTDDEVRNDSEANNGNAVVSENEDGASAQIGDLDIDVSYGEDMTATAMPGDDMVCVEYGSNSRLYIKDVTDVYDPNTADPSEFLYEYAYESCIELVTENFGQILEFNGEKVIATSGNELYGYGANMTCAHQIPVYAFIKLVTVDNGYAVMIGVCEEANMNVFDDVAIG